jgi:hypothetical protein
MTTNKKLAIERGLERTKAFFASHAFQKFLEKEKREDKYGHLKPGLTETEIDELVKLCNDRFGCSPPEGWLCLLRTTNGFFSRIHGYDATDDSGFIHRNTYNLENEYFCDDDGKLIYFMIGWEDESYLGYNFQTGKYADLYNVAHDEYMIFHSFSDLFIHHLKINSYKIEFEQAISCFY